MPLIIRPATLADAPALSRICLLTAAAGRNAEPKYVFGELPGYIWAEPYVHITGCTWGFVLADDTAAPGEHGTDAVKGYILGATDTRAFEARAEANWWPPIRARFPLVADGERKEGDEMCIGILHRGPDPALEACIAFSPAHMHIDLLPEVQRQGWGRKLIGHAVRYLREKGLSTLWLGLDLANEDANKFYRRLGFEPIEGAPDNLLGLRFDTATWAE